MTHANNLWSVLKSISCVQNCESMCHRIISWLMESLYVSFGRGLGGFSYLIFSCVLEVPLKSRHDWAQFEPELCTFFSASYKICCSVVLSLTNDTLTHSEIAGTIVFWDATFFYFLSKNSFYFLILSNFYQFQNWGALTTHRIFGNAQNNVQILNW